MDMISNPPNKVFKIYYTGGQDNVSLGIISVLQ